MVGAAVPRTALLRIIRAEDERRWDADLVSLLSDPNPVVRARAALAAGRIGDERAVPGLVSLLLTDKDNEVKEMAAFALGETESVSAGDALVAELAKRNSAAKARVIEALGKITAALPATDEARLKSFRKEIYDALEFEAGRRSAPDTEVILLGVTAALRARPEGVGKVIAEFLTYGDPRIRSDSANALARLRAKDGNEELRKLLTSDPDANVRANAARVLGVTEDKASIDKLLDRARNDTDPRVRVSAIRALGIFKERNDDVDTLLLERGMRLLEKASEFGSEKNEILEIASTLGNRLTKKKDEYVESWLRELRETFKFKAPEVELALVRIDPIEYVQDAAKTFRRYEALVIVDDKEGKRLSLAERWHHLPVLAPALGEVARIIPAEDKENAATRRTAETILLQTISEGGSFSHHETRDVPEVMRAYAAFKPEGLGDFLIDKIELQIARDTPVDKNRKRLLIPLDHPAIIGRYAISGRGSKYLTPPDIAITSTAADLLSELPSEEFTTTRLAEALVFALQETENDAALSVLGALAHQKNTEANDLIKTALDSKDHLVRRRAVALLKANGVGDFSNRIGTVQTRNTPRDYERALARLGKSVHATLSTGKGSFTIELLPDDAPLNVDNFVQLAKGGYFNGIVFHRVVPNFVVQGGDPHGDGNGGPGYSIRCEINEVPYERGAVGMALSGKDTGGSQWFVTHAPQPHLDGGYTVFGRVVKGMDVVDNIARGDLIRSITVRETTPGKLNRRR